MAYNGQHHNHSIDELDDPFNEQEWDYRTWRSVLWLPADLSQLADQTRASAPPQNPS